MSAAGPGSSSKPPGARAMLALAHGASAGMRHPFLEKLSAALAAESIATLRYEFPYMEQGKRRIDRPPVLHERVREAVAVAARERLPLFAGGKSMGGRMTSLAASEQKLETVRGLIFFGFPLHPPKRPSIKRTQHLHLVKLPMLFLQGTRDDLADLSLLRPICESLGPQTTLHIIEGADHSFHVLKRSGKTDSGALSELSSTVKAWMAAHSAA